MAPPPQHSGDGWPTDAQPGSSHPSGGYPAPPGQPHGGYSYGGEVYAGQNFHQNYQQQNYQQQNYSGQAPAHGKSRTGLILGIVAGVVVLIAGGVLAAIFWLGEGDDADGNQEESEPAAPDATPAEVVDRYYQALNEDDCDAVSELVTEDFTQRRGECVQSNLEAQEDIDFELGEETISDDEESATVEVTFTLPQESSGESAERFTVFDLVREDDAWKVEDFD